MTSHLLILDVTAMHGSAVCVAGLDMDTGHTLRLNSPTPDLTTVRKLGVKPGILIEVDWKPVHPQSHPHTEDGAWDEHTVKIVRSLPLTELIAAISPFASASIGDAFGKALFRGTGGSGAWPPGIGPRSLATIAATRLSVFVDPWNKAKASFTDAEGMDWRNVPFKDVEASIHQVRCSSCSTSFNGNLDREYSRSAKSFIRVGLARPEKMGEHEVGCWLQVTNILARERTHFV